MPQPTSQDRTKDANSPDWTPDAYDKAVPVWEDCRAVAAGTRAVRAAGTRYLPRNPAEEPEDYRDRLAGVELFNGFGSTIDAMAGLVFGSDPQLAAGADPATTEEWEDIDGAGNAAAVFLRRLYTDGMIVGRAGILVDFPALQPGLTLADELSLNARPYWCHITTEQVLSWRVEKDGAATVFTQLVIREYVDAPLGVFGSQCVVQYRVFRRQRDVIVWELWQEELRAGKRKPRRIRSGSMIGPTRIPFSPFCPASDGGLWDGPPPLLDLLDLNLAHYRVTGERRYAIHLACSPTPVRTGYMTSKDETAEGERVIIGPTRLQDLPQGATFEWKAPPSGWDTPTENELKMLEGRMAAIGLSMLQNETRAAETATGVRVHNAAQMSKIAASVVALRDCVNAALADHAAWTRREPTTCDLAADLDQLTLEPEMVTSYSSMVAQGQLSLDTMWQMLLAGKRLPPNFNPATEKARIANAPSGNDGATDDGDGADDEAGDEDATDPADTRAAA